MKKRMGHLLLAWLALAGAIEFHGANAAAAAEADAVPPRLAAGVYYSVSLISDGTVWSWGRGGSGELGNGQTNNAASPVKVSGLNGATVVSSGFDSAYALMNDGTVRAWGKGDSGQLGDGAASDRLVPVAVTGLAGIKAISGGPSLHALAVDGDGSVWAWGSNEGGQLGDGTTVQRNAPVEVPGLSDIKAVAAGGSFSLALTESGQVWSWGWNKQGQLGDGTAAEQRPAPAPIPGLSRIVAISAGYNHALALDEDGFVWGWGQNTNGAVGDGTNSERRSPVKLAGIDHVTSISAGFFHNLAVRDDGTLWAWGLNNYYQLGNGDNANRNYPVQVPGLSRVATAAAGEFHSLAMDRDGAGWAWGYNGGGLLGDGTGTSRTGPAKNLANMDVTSPDVGDGTLTVTGGTATGLTLHWPKASDNMTEQSGLRYAVFLSTAGNIDTASHALANGTLTGSYVTDGESMEVTGLEPGTAYYFNVVAEDLAGNKSAYAMRQAATEPLPSYSLVYDGNGSLGGSVPEDGSVYEEGMTATVQGNTGLLERAGYSFAGWNTAADGSGDSYPAGAPLIFGSADITLYAQWIPDTAADTEAPKIAAFTPDNGAVGVGIGAELAVTFDEPVAAVAGKSVTIRKGADNSAVENFEATDTQRVIVSGAQVTIHPAAALSDGTAYYVQIDAGAFRDAAGNGFAGLSGPAEWGFSTEVSGAGPGPEGDASLSRLDIFAGTEPVTLSPEFVRSGTDYSVSLPNSVSSLTVTASVYDSRAGAAVSLYDGAGRLVSGPFPLPDGRASGLLPVNVGSSRIELTVTAPDGTVQIYKIAAFRASDAYVPPSPPPEGEPEANEPDPDSSAVQSELTVNGRSAGGVSDESVDDSGGRISVTVTLDTDKLLADLAQEALHPLVRIETETAADRTSLQLTGEAYKALEDKGAILELRTPDGSYSLPAERLSIGSLSGQLGAFELQDVVVRLDIVRSGKERIAALQSAAEKLDFKTIAQPLEFSITASYGGAAVEADSFDGYVEREIALPDWASPNLLTTAVALEDDGTAHPVPTRVVVRGGGNYAVASSMTNSMYALVYRPVSFADMSGHWAERAVSDMGSRMIVNGAELHRFDPGADVTRAEFAAMLIRALGLPERGETASFTDVEADDWFASAAAAAQRFGIMEGDPDGAFRPGAGITREEAAAVLVRAMKLAGMPAEISDGEIDRVLAAFKDGAQISRWARQAAAVAASSGLESGADAMLRPGSGLTRAEAAVMVQRLLRQSGLID